MQLAGDGCRREFGQRRLTIVGHDTHPVVGTCQHLFDGRQRQILAQLDGQCLTVAAHGAHPNADALDRNVVFRRATQHLVQLGVALPLLARHAVAQVLVDPGQQAACQGEAELLGGEIRRTHGLSHRTVDVQDVASRIRQLGCHRCVDCAHLTDQLPHVLCTTARGGLIGHCRDPLDLIRLQQTAESHHHQANRAVTANEIPITGLYGRINDMAVDRIQHDHGLFVHPQRRRCIDPEAFPAGCAQLRMDIQRVVAALAGDDSIKRGQGLDVVGIAQRRIAHGRLATRVRRAEEHRIEQIEVLLGAHPVHQDRTHHATPAHQTNPILPAHAFSLLVPGRITGAQSAATTASPISVQLDTLSPGRAISAVRPPSASTFRTAASTRRAAASSSSE